MIKKEDIKVGIMFTLFAKDSIFRIAKIDGNIVYVEELDFRHLKRREGDMIKGCIMKYGDIVQENDIVGPNNNDTKSRYECILDKLHSTYVQKNHDYGNSFSELFKDCGMTYAYGHIAEKLSRIKSLMKDEAKVKGESIKDSLYDLANYAILTIMELEKGE